MSIDESSFTKELSDSINEIQASDSATSSETGSKTKPMRTPRTPASGPKSPGATNDKVEMVPKKSDAGSIFLSNNRKDIGESAFFAFVQTTKLEDSIDDYKAMSSVDHEKAKFLRLLEEERKRNEVERKELEERIQQEEQLQQQMTSLAAQRQQDHSRSLQSLAAENLQLKEGVESLLNEMKRIQAEKIALQERIKASFAIFDQENRELQKVADSIQNDISSAKKEKKVLIDKITEITYGKLSRSSNSQLPTTNIPRSSSPSPPQK